MKTKERSPRKRKRGFVLILLFPPCPRFRHCLEYHSDLPWTCFTAQACLANSWLCEWNAIGRGHELCFWREKGEGAMRYRVHLLTLVWFKLEDRGRSGCVLLLTKWTGLTSRQPGWQKTTQQEKTPKQNKTVHPGKAAPQVTIPSFYYYDIFVL